MLSSILKVWTRLIKHRTGEHCRFCVFSENFRIKGNGNLFLKGCENPTDVPPGGCQGGRTLFMTFLILLSVTIKRSIYQCVRVCVIWLEKSIARTGRKIWFREDEYSSQCTRYKFYIEGVISPIMPIT